MPQTALYIGRSQNGDMLSMANGSKSLLPRRWLLEASSRLFCAGIRLLSALGLFRSTIAIQISNLARGTGIIMHPGEEQYLEGVPHH